MDAMKEALKRKMDMMKNKGDGEKEVHVDINSHNEGEMSDLAPEGGEENGEEENGKGEIDVDQLMMILQAIADQGRGGEDDNSLGGKAAMLAKAKMASMKK